MLMADSLVHGFEWLRIVFGVNAPVGHDRPQLLTKVEQKTHRLLF